VLQGAADYGLLPEDYGASSLSDTLASLQADSSAKSEQWLAFDIDLSNAALMFLHDLHFGRVDPRAAHFDMPRRPEHFDDAHYLEQLAEESDSAAVVAQLEPHYLHYRLLRKALARYRELEDTMPAGPLPTLPRSVAPGRAYIGSPAIRRLLVALGDLSPDQAANGSTVLDAPLVDGLKRFQYLHGLRESGALDAGTYAALNVPLAQRVRQIELTLERWRWVPPLEPPALIVNIPQFRLFLIRSTVDSEAEMLRMNVIVGKVYPQLHTPIFTSEMKAVLFRPYWDVPSSIARAEILPLLRKNPRYLDRENLELVTSSAPAIPLAVTPENLQGLAAGKLRLRQRPGPDNALGLIKFVLPNAYSVYLHSTPAQRLFDEPRRAFSHGCIRVSDPVALAVEVLRDTPGNWTAEKVRAAMTGNSTFQVDLAQPVHVLILYGTAVATEDGAVHFFDDIYGDDRMLETLLGLKPVTSGL
jgi:murein L,D-transpeptidase YcbB/YkuD